jgi:hypothetical protein
VLPELALKIKASHFLAMCKQMETIYSTPLVGRANPPLPPAVSKLAALIFELVDEQVERSLRLKQAELKDEQAAAEAETIRNEKRIDKHVAAAECHVTPQTIWTWYQKGTLRGAKVGNRILFRLGDVKALLKDKTQPDGRRKYSRRTTTNEKSY